MKHHEALDHIAFLIGTWEGTGSGTYPTIEDFTYAERVTFDAPHGKAFLAYSQATRRTGSHPGSGLALHTESGYLRPIPPNGVELVLAQPTGIVEVHAGRVGDGVIEMRAETVAVTGTAKEVRSVERNLSVEGDTLRYEVLIGAVGQNHQLHLRAELRRVE